MPKWKVDSCFPVDFSFPMVYYTTYIFYFFLCFIFPTINIGGNKKKWIFLILFLFCFWPFLVRQARNPKNKKMCGLIRSHRETFWNVVQCFFVDWEGVWWNSMGVRILTPRLREWSKCFTNPTSRTSFVCTPFYI